MRWGQRMGDSKAIDPVVGALNDPWDSCHMGITAENVAEDYNISREDQDALAVESHRRAAAATAAHYFDEQITPIEVKVKKKTVEFKTDEHFREDVSLESMARLRPAFAKDGTVTAGNASGMNDAASAVVLATGAYAESHGLQPLGRLVAYSHAASSPGSWASARCRPPEGAGEERPEAGRDRRVRGERGLRGPGLAASASSACPRTGRTPTAAASRWGTRSRPRAPSLTVKALYELRRTGGRYALVTMCIGAGQGIAAIYERL